MPSEPVLLFAYGNESRGDDALGPLLLQQIRNAGLQQGCGHPLIFLSDYQMQIEHVTDMHSCIRVLLMDASVSLDQPYRFYSVDERKETLYTTHGMSASTLMHTYRQVYGDSAPVTAMLALQGQEFELGKGLSLTAHDSLQQATHFLLKLLRSANFSLWDEQVSATFGNH
jgi:hydrogenase maturation protease